MLEVVLTGDLSDIKDIVILLRSVSTASTIFDRVFQEKGIPLYIESESGYFDALLRYGHWSACSP